MKISFIGTGYVGLVSGTCFAELGHEVTCIDIDNSKIESLKSGKMPIYEPGLEELVIKHSKSNRLSFANSIEEGIKDSEIIFIAVGTPTDEENGSADLSYVYGAAEELAQHISDNVLIVTKSTVPVGTGKKVKEILAKAGKPNALVASNPEFLREGCAVNDFLNPDRIIIGVDSEETQAKLTQLYKPLTKKSIPILTSDIQTAELTKYAANAFLATKIAFINEIADMCEKMDADVNAVAKGIGSDHRIGENYLSPGPGYGGSCFPKDTLALQHMAAEYQTGENIISGVINSNDKRKDGLSERVINALGGKAKGKKVAILGLAFKANTDDMRESASIPLIENLVGAGAEVKAYDPEAMEQAKSLLDSNVEYTSGIYECLEGADIAVICTEWPEFTNLDFEKLKSAMANPLIVDLRNLYNPDHMAERGISYISVGRKSVKTQKNKLSAVS